MAQKMLVHVSLFYRFLLHTEESNAKQIALVDQNHISAYDKANITNHLPSFHQLSPFMKLLLPVAILYILKLLDLSFMENVSWWWINGLGLFAFLWFEFFERMLGLDKRKDEMLHEKMLKERQKRQFNIRKK